MRDPAGNKVLVEAELPQTPLQLRLGYLRALQISLEKSRVAVLCSDLANLVLETARQRELCVALSGCTANGNLAIPAMDLLQESAAAETQVARSNRQYAALLRRARRTVDIFCRVLANSQLTYVPPKSFVSPGLGG